MGLGVGWLKEEFDALGVPWERRGARNDESSTIQTSTPLAQPADKTHASHNGDVPHGTHPTHLPVFSNST